ncbi:MAG: hypothetical protein ACI86H_002454 [bacterium]|jgi:hypothetical protein
MEVVFNSGKIYCYQEIPKELYQKLWSNTSKGKFMREFIIDQYPSQQLNN